MITPLTPEWHEARRNRITATDAAAILGLTNFKTPLSVWSRITGRDEGPEFTGNAFTEWGNATEEANRLLLSKTAGLDVKGSPGLIVHPELDWLAATPDGVLEDEDGALGVWEGKSPSQWTRDQWTEDSAPLGYLAQLQVQMACLGADFGILSALTPPRSAEDQVLWWRRIERNQDLERQLLERLEAWWNTHVVGDVPPPASGAQLDRRLLERANPESDDQKAVVLRDEVAQAAARLLELKAQQSELKKERDGLEGLIRQAIGGASYAVVPDGGPVFSYRWTTTTIKAKPATPESKRDSRTLRVIKSLPGDITPS